jgi:hypothetical protein
MDDFFTTRFLDLCDRETKTAELFRSGNGSRLRRLRLARLWEALYKATTTMALGNITVAT